MSFQNVYKQQSVATAPPGKLLIMLLDGLVRFIHQAGLAIEQNKIDEAHNNLCRAQDIVLELRSTLDHEKAPELCEGLHDLYTYYYSTLVEANRLKSKEKIDEVYVSVLEVRDSFAEADRVSSQER
jgi:flagellar secretion chaperone FliS